MRNFRFYLEYPSNKEKRQATVKKTGNHCGTVFAQSLENGWHVSQGEIHTEGAAAIFDRPNSDVCWGSASDGYLRERCKRIPEKLAREIHPKLFYYLEQ